VLEINIALLSLWCLCQGIWSWFNKFFWSNC